MPAVVLPNIGTAKFTTTGGNTPRTLIARAGDVLNVKDYGVKGDFLADDADAIQAVFDLAFGPASSPHGLANAYQNRPVFFPNGHYKVGKTLNLTRVVGGLIFGAGAVTTTLEYTGAIPGGATVTPLIKINGMARSSIRTMQLSGGGTVGQNTCAIDVDWNNAPGGDGLHDNEFYFLSFGADYGMIIGRSNNGGANQLITAPFAGGLTVAVDNRGTGAWNTQVVHGSGGGGGAYKVSNGSLITWGGSGEATGILYQVSGASSMLTVHGGRTETTTPAKTFDVSGGLVRIIGFNQSTPGTFANITGGKVYIETSHLNQAGGVPGAITGNGGQLYLRANLTVAGYRSGYTGTLVTNPAEE